MKIGVGAAVVVALGAALTAMPSAGADKPVCSGTKCSFTSPNQSIDCVITFQAGPGNPDGVFCGWADGERSHTVRMASNGALDPCINPAVQLVDRCTFTDLTGATALGYGQSASLGPYTCVAEAQAITCTVTPPGKGFTMNRAGILPVLPPPPPPPPEPTAAPPPPEPTAPPAAPAPPSTDTPIPVPPPPAAPEPPPADQ